MRLFISKTNRYLALFLGLAASSGMLLSSCDSPVNESFTTDGSSTVYPITQAVAKKYLEQNLSNPPITVKFSGTTAGFRQFCEGKTPINDASRPITQSEIDLCNQNNIRFIELPIAFDALTLVVNPQNTWVSSLTVAELKKIWEPAAQGTLTRWNQVQPTFPNEPLNLVGPGTDSGTFDYFTEAIIGQARSSRLDYIKTEDDQITVQAVEQNPNALGYFGFAYYEQNAKHLKAIAVDSGQGPIAPSKETVENSQYSPLSRPLFIYVNFAAAQQNKNLKNFVEFYLKTAPKTVAQVGYVPLPQEGYQLAAITFQNGEAGTVFEGKAQIGMTIGELLRKKAKF